MIGRNASEFLHPDDLEISRGKCGWRAARQRAQNTDSRYVHKDGRIVMLSWMGTWSEPVRRYFFVGRDMTESRLAQETLRESEQLARGIIDTALDAFVQIDESGSILNWNSQAEKIFGWPRKDALGKNFIELIIAESERGELKAALDRFVRSGQGQILGNRREIRALRRDGKEFPAELSVTALRRREGILFNGFFRDLTDKIAAEDRIRQSEKMEALGQLTGGIAHDFNNILTVITGTIEILAEAVDEGAAACGDHPDDRRRRGARRGSHPASAGVRPQAAAAAARDRHQHADHRHRQAAAADARRAYRDRIGIRGRSLRRHRRPQSARHRHPQSVAQRPRRHARRRQADPRNRHRPSSTKITRAMHGDIGPGRYALIAVSDTGTGIPAAILDKVFNPFFTSKGPGKGTGLGLSMVYGFVKQSAGHIKIYSEEGHGTTIKMYLPPGTGALGRLRSRRRAPRSKAATKPSWSSRTTSWCGTTC